jgi:hypothetical protein
MRFSFSTRGQSGISLELFATGPMPADLARHVPFAAALALNRTADEAARITRRKVAKRFINRGPQSDRFFDASFTVTQFATKRDLQVAFGIGQRLSANASTVRGADGGLQRRAVSLIGHEDGEDRLQPMGVGNADLLYIPAIGSSLRPSIRDSLPRWAYPKALGLLDAPLNGGGRSFGQDRTPSRRGDKRGQRARENRKAFILRRDDGSPIGIFRRIPLAGQRVAATREGGTRLTLAQRRRRGSGQSVLELLFATPKVIKLRPRLGFRADALTVMQDRIEANFAGMLALASDQARMDRQRDLAAADSALYRR